MRRAMVMVASLTASLLLAASPATARPGIGGARTPNLRPVGSTPYAEKLTDTTGVTVNWNVQYSNASPTQVLDVVHPAQQPAKAPLVVMIHGGAFMSGSKTDADITSAVGAFVDKGFVAASINYRLSGEAKFPAAIRDAKAAVSFLRSNAAAYGIDPNRIAVMGDSAGGYLAAVLGTTSGTTAFGGDASGTRVQAVVDRYGPSNFASMNAQAVCGAASQDHDGPSSPESVFLGAPVQSAPALVKQADPATYAGTGKLPPFLLEHGTKDCLVPPGQSQYLRDALADAGGTATLNLLQGWSHADSRFDGRNPATANWVASVLGS